MSSTIPYIGSKISLISNSEIRYEGILYTINTQESTIALQSVKTFGTEGRKIPEIPPSSEIYDFIIFRGQDIKDLTVLEGAQNPSSPMLSDPAIMSLNQRPAGGPGKGKDSPKGSEAKGGGKASQSKGSGGYDRGYDKGYDKGSGSGWNSSWNHSNKGSSKGMSDYSKGSGKHESWGSKGRSDAWGYSKGGGKWDDSSKGKGASSYKGAIKGGKSKDIQVAEKGGKGKGKAPVKGGKDSGSKGKKGESKGDRGGSRRTGGASSGSTSAVPVGELLPEENAAVKKECAEDFDVAAANTKFDKVTETTEPGESTAKPLTGYDKTKSFFDNISCEATDRATDNDRPKVDRDKARQFDRETFGDTRRPPRPVGIRRGNGKGKGGSKGGYQS